LPVLSAGFRAYIGAWVLALASAAVVAARSRRTLELWQPAYLRFLAVRWRVVTFAIAAITLTVVAPYTGDPTWDYADAAFMSVLAFATAPWAVGCLFRALRGPRQLAHAYVALVVWLFCASWSYDLYILLRDGVYPPSWLSNMGASSILYVAAGLFWSLDWRPGRGATFAFLEPDWPATGPTGHFGKIIAYGLAFMALVTLTMGYVFFRDRL
jgi:hypothetical protein